MSHLRQDPLTGRWVIMAAGRRGRPNEYPLRREKGGDPADCPFCLGQEARTTREILAVGRQKNSSPNTAGWRLRVFPNLYPALTPEGSGPSLHDPDEEVPSSELFVQEPGVGAHEIIAYSPDHNAGLGTLSLEDLTELLQVLQERFATLAKDPKHRCILQFVNHGAEAGATLSHPHLQILAMPMVPLAVQEKLDRMEVYRRQEGRCLLCDLLAAERKKGIRIIDENENWTAFAPWASRFPWEMMLVPRRHQGSIMEATSMELHELARLLGKVLGRLDVLHGDPPLNLIIQGAPLENELPKAYFAEGTEAVDGFHWHVEVCPRLSRLAGFEAGSGFAINSVLPEEAAGRLREQEG
ncbi:MAG: galactose-1-phosphate uridylyltransferase [Gemmatimonadales bacterium]|nr:galactose-1-phosphate uridylyltransferase [Gemmatimonadales bacterium]